jgi:hypothetical protein
MIIQRENRVRAPASIGRIELDAALLFVMTRKSPLDTIISQGQTSQMITDRNHSAPFSAKAS